MPGMTRNEALQLWADLSGKGTAPTEIARASRVLPSYSVAIAPWLDRLAATYLRQLSREAAHFKLVMAPYGGGKTHFLLALGAQALEENFAVSYVPCGEGVSPDSPLEVHRELVKYLRLPGQREPGLRSLLSQVVRAKQEEISRRGAPDADVAFWRWLGVVERENYPENAFGRVVAAALRAENDPDSSPAGEAALRWLQGDTETLAREEMSELRLARIPAANRNKFGHNLLSSLVKFVPEAGVHGTVLLMDEVETLFARRGKALLRILAAMRVFLDAPSGVPDGLPLFGVFSAVPDCSRHSRSASPLSRP